MADQEFELTVTVRIPGFGDPAREAPRLAASLERAAKLMVSPGAMVDGAVAVGVTMERLRSGQSVDLPLPEGSVIANGFVVPRPPIKLVKPPELGPDPEFGWTHLCEESPDSPGWCAYHRSYCTAAGPGPHVTDHPE
jgi:hypothetical protein